MQVAFSPTPQTAVPARDGLPSPLTPDPAQQPIELVVQFRQPFANPFNATHRVGRLSVEHVYAGLDTVQETFELAGRLAAADAERAAHAVLRAPNGQLMVTRVASANGAPLTFEEDLGKHTGNEWYSPLSPMLLALAGAGPNVGYLTERGRAEWNA